MAPDSKTWRIGIDALSLSIAPQLIVGMLKLTQTKPSVGLGSRVHETQNWADASFHQIPLIGCCQNFAILEMLLIRLARRGSFDVYHKTTLLVFLLMQKSIWPHWCCPGIHC